MSTNYITSKFTESWKLCETKHSKFPHCVWPWSYTCTFTANEVFSYFNIFLQIFSSQSQTFTYAWTVHILMPQCTGRLIVWWCVQVILIDSCSPPPITWGGCKCESGVWTRGSSCGDSGLTDRGYTKQTGQTGALTAPGSASVSAHDEGLQVVLSGPGGLTGRWIWPGWVSEFDSGIMETMVMRSPWMHR